MAVGELSRDAVLKAIEECRDAGRAAFLGKYGFGDATRWVVVHGGVEYDSKAIAAVAYGYEHPDEGPLRSGQLSGGEETVRVLERAGFTVRERRHAASTGSDEGSGAGGAVWLVRGGEGGSEERIALERGCVVAGWEQLGDLSRTPSVEALADQLQGSDPKYESKGTRTRHARELWRLVREMREGDRVVMPLLSRPGLVAIGEVRGDYQHRPDFPVNAKHTRPVEWLRKEVPRASVGALGSVLSYRGTIRRVTAADANTIIRNALAAAPGRSWLFNSNPKYYDIKAAVHALRQMNWTVAQSQRQIHAGDVVYFWASGSDGGLIGRGTILTDPQMMPAQEGPEFIRDAEKFAGEQLRVRVSIEQVLDEPIGREVLGDHPVLRELTVLKFANATNFRVTPEQNEALEDLFRASRERRSGPGYREVSLQTIESRIVGAGLRIDPRTLRRFHVSLKTRGFVILSGISGTGKTWLSEVYADAVGARHKVVPVAPNWTTNEDLLGYLSPLTGAYQDTPFSAYLREAESEFKERGPRARPFHMLLDEMNLARVEYYFAKFLSAMEIRSRFGTAPLELAPGHDVLLTPNLFFVGTVNMDETTHGFADKVFDRAQLIELRITRSALKQHLVGAAFGDALLEVWDAVKDVAPFAFRVVDEVRTYVDESERFGATWEEALDEQLLQKVLPKLTGADLGVQNALERFLLVSADRFGLSAEKAQLMLATYREHGFTSYF